MSEAAPSAERKTPPTPIPLTVLTGFLGAGKTDGDKSAKPAAKAPATKSAKPAKPAKPKVSATTQ